MRYPGFLLVVAVSVAAVLGQGETADLRKERDRLSIFFGVVPGEYTARAEDLAANAFATLELERHVVATAEVPKPRFRDAARVAAYFPEGYTLRVRFTNARGEEAADLATPGVYEAWLDVQVNGGRTYGPVRRVVVRVPEGEAITEASEEAVLKRIAAAKLGREWREDVDPSLFTYAMRVRWDADRAAGRVKPNEWLVLLPPDYEAGKAAGRRYPLYIDLHGSGALRFDLAKFTADPYFETFKPVAARGVIVIAPLSGQQWQAPAVLDVLDRAEAQFAVDTGRVYLGGHSMGGSGTWRVLDAAPERFAAAMPVSGGNVPPPAKARRFTGLPIWVGFGEKEGPDGHARSDALVRAINAAGGDARFTLVPDANHMQARNRFFADAAAWDWLLQQRKEPARAAAETDKVAKRVLALQSFLAPEDEAVVERLSREAAARVPGADCAFTYGAVPHLTTGSWTVSDAQFASAVATLKERVGEIAPLELSVKLEERAFKRGVLHFFLIPEAGESLLAYHAEIHRRLGYDFTPFREKDRVGNWWPHITLFAVPADKREAVADLVKELGAIRRVRLTAVGLVAFDPLRTVVEVPLKAAR